MRSAFRLGKLVSAGVNRSARDRKSQSALEYLTNYGWAILLIALAAVLLYKLNLFTPNFFAPRVQPGACEVYRPYGPGTTQLVNLRGLCSGGLPAYVAIFDGSNSSYVSRKTIFMPLYWGDAVTVSAWVNFNKIYQDSNGHAIVSDSHYTNDGYLLYQGTDPPYDRFKAFISNGNVPLHHVYSNTLLTTGKWYNVVMTWRNWGNIDIYINGALDNASAGPGWMANPGGSMLLFGQTYEAGRPNQGGFNGSIVNIQLYNHSLAQDDVQALYAEGIGGAPIDLKDLVGWWPLNGDAKDYSGNGYDGNAVNVTWSNSYSYP